jgi:hypothetical protein
MQWQQLRPWLRRTRHSRRRRRQWLRGPPRPPLDHPPNEASMTMTPSKAPQRDLRGAARGMTSDHQWGLRGVTLEGDAEQVQLQVFTQAALLMITVQRAPLFQSMRFSPSSRQKAGPLLLVGRARPHHGHLAGRRAVSRSDMWAWYRWPHDGTRGRERRGVRVDAVDAINARVMQCHDFRIRVINMDAHRKRKTPQHASRCDSAR